MLKRKAYHILCAWALLLSFVTGQYMVYAHQHNLVKNIHANCKDTKHAWHQTVEEKCPLCDSMHHAAMDMSSNLHHAIVLEANLHTYVSPSYNFKSFSLILASGRAPPVIS